MEGIITYPIEIESILSKTFKVFLYSDEKKI